MQRLHLLTDQIRDTAFRSDLSPIRITAQCGRLFQHRIRKRVPAESSLPLLRSTYDLWLLGTALCPCWTCTIASCCCRKTHTTTESVIADRGL